MKPAWQRGPIEDAGSQTIAKFDHMSSKPRHVWQGWFLSHEKIKFISMDHPELCISNCKLEVVKAPEPAKLHKLVWRRKTTERPSFLRLTRCQFNAHAKWYAAKWHNICVKWWCDVMLRDVMVSEVRWCDAMRWDVGPWGGQMPLFLLKFRSERCCFNHRKLGNLPIGKQKVRPFEHMEEMKCHHVA